MSDVVLSKNIAGIKGEINSMYTKANLTAKNVNMPLPSTASIGVGAVFKLADIQLLTAAVNILETQFSGNCNCMQNTAKCQSCQGTTCQSSKCQSCQSQCVCNCNCGDDDGSNY